MSFVKRADRVTYNTGGHSISRGTLSQVKYGSDYSHSELDEEWLKQVVSAMMPLEESIEASERQSNYGCGEEDCKTISLMYGKYYNTCPFVKRKVFDEDYFYPGY